MDTSASEDEWSGVVASSLACLKLNLPSVSPIPAAPAIAKATTLESDYLRQASEVPTALTPSISRRPGRNWSFPTWYRVGGGNNEVVISSPHRPRTESPWTDSPRRAPTLSMRPVSAATSVATPGVFALFDKNLPCTAATEAGGNAADVAAPMHGQVAVGHRTGETTRRLVMTAPPPSPRAENLGKRSRSGNRTRNYSAVAVRNRTGLAKGRVASGNGHQSDSIPSKSRRMSGPDVEPVVASQLAVRRPEVVARLAVQCDDFAGDFLMQGAGGGEVEKGAQAVCGRPLVPRPSSPRAQGECHPWHFSLDRLMASGTPSAREEPWRLEAGETEVSSDCGHQPGPAPLFTVEHNKRRVERPLRGRQPGQDHLRTLSDAAGYDRRNGPSTGRNSGDDDSASGSERVIAVLRTDGSIVDKVDAAGSRDSAGGRVRESHLQRKRRVRSLMETSSIPEPGKGMPPPGSSRDDTELRLLQDEQDSIASGSSTSISSTIKIVSVRLSSSSSRGARWGQCVYDPDGDKLDQRGGSVGPGDGEGLARDGNCAFPEERKPTSGSRNQTSRTESSTSGRKMLGDAGAGEIYVAEGVGKVAGHTGLLRTITEPSGNMGSSTTQPAESETNYVSPGEEDIECAGQKPKTRGKTAAGRSAWRKARKRTVVDVALAAAQRKLEAKLKAKDMLKSARGFVVKGRWNRAHSVLCEAIEFNGAPNLLVVLHELRARVRSVLGLWVEASEDIRLALKGLEQSEDVTNIDSDEERMEEANLSGKKRWRAIVNRTILRRHHAQAGLATIVSTLLASRRGLRARVLLVAAKCLAQENKLEAAISYTREVRALAARHSTLPGGSSGVATTVIHEAFKLEIQWLRDTDQFCAAVATAREMDAQVAREIGDQRLLQGDDRRATEDAPAPETGGSSDWNGLRSILFSDIETDDANPDETIEAGVWAKVTIAALCTRKLTKPRKTGAASGKDAAPLRKKKERKRKRRARREARAAGSPAAAASAGSFGKVASAAVKAAASAVDVEPSQQRANFGRIPSSAEVIVCNTVTTEDNDLMGSPPLQRAVEEAEMAGEGGGGDEAVPTKLVQGDQASSRASRANKARQPQEDKEVAFPQHLCQDEDTGAADDESMGMRQPRCLGGGHEQGPHTSVDGPDSDEVGLETMVHFTKHEDRGEKQAEADDGRGLEAKQGTANNGCGIVSAEASAGKGQSDDERRTEGDSESGIVPAEASGGKQQSNDERRSEGDCESEEEEEEEEEDEEEDEDADEDADEEEEKGREGDQKELAKTEEENRYDLEAAIDSLQGLLSNEEMTWRADTRTPRILATALVRLADLAVDPADNDSVKNISGTEAEKTTTNCHPSRQEILERGEESLRRMFAALEGKLSSLVSAWKPIWRAHCHAKHIPVKRGNLGRGGGGWGRMRSQLKAPGAADSTKSLPEMARELLVSVAEAGVDIEAHFSKSGTPLSDSIGGVRDDREDSGEEGRPEISHGRGGRLHPKQKKRGKLPKELEARLSQLLKVISMIAEVLEQRAHIAKLAGEDPEDIFIPLLERAIAYLCLPRKSPPGGPPMIGTGIFGSSASTSATNTKIVSLRAACMAAGAAKAKQNGLQTNAAAKPAKSTGNQPRPVTASAGEVAALPSSSSGGRKPQTSASAAKLKAVKRTAAKAPAQMAELLLPWDADSLASLLNCHQALAATLLGVERSLTLAADSTTKENRRNSMPGARTEAENIGAGNYECVDDTGDDTGDHHHRPQSKQSTELLKRADANLTAALAAAGVGVKPVSPPFPADPNTTVSFPEAVGIVSNNPEEAGFTPTFGGGPLSSSRPPSSPSRLSTPLNMVSDDEGGPCKRVGESRSPTFPGNKIPPVIPVTMMVRDTDADYKTTDLEWDQSFSKPQGEAKTVCSPPSGFGEGSDKRLPGYDTKVQELPQRRGGDINTVGEYSFLATTAGGTDSETLAELYSMRCMAKEGLRLTRDAFWDCRAALAAAPRAPKLWAKAASLALQLGSDAERREKRSSKGASSKDWAGEALRLASGLLQLCPRSHLGYLFRGQAAERIGQYGRAMRDYCRAQHVRPSATVPALLRARLDALLGRLETERPGGETGERQTNDAIDAMKAFLWSPFLPVDDVPAPTPGLPASLPRKEREARGIQKSAAVGARIGGPTAFAITSFNQMGKVVWWQGRVKEYEGSYLQATEIYERVHEKQPTIDRLNHLASSYLSAQQPGKADQILSKFLDGTGSVIGAPTALATAAAPEYHQDDLSPSPGKGSPNRDAGFSTARLLRGRALFILGRDEQCTASFRSALKGGFEQASILFEWSLSEAISTCMCSAGSPLSEIGETVIGNVTVVGPPLPAITGIAAWDSALLQDYHRRKRAQQLAAAAAVAATAAAAAAAAGRASVFSNEDAASIVEASPSTPLSAQTCSSDAERRAKTSMVPILQGPGASSAATATATAAATAVSAQAAGAYCEETNDDSDASASETMDSMSSSDHEGCDSAQEQDAQDGDLDSLDYGLEHEIAGEPRHSLEQPVNDKLVGGEERSPSDEDPDKQRLLDLEPQRMEVLEEGEPLREERKPAMRPGRSKSSSLHSRRRTRKLRGLHGALELANRCLRKDRFNAKAYGLRAELEMRLGRRDRAIADYRAAASLEIGDPRPRINMAVVHLNTSRSGLACAQFDSIERASKGSVERVLAAFNLGVAAATVGELSRAEAAFTRALGILSTGGASRDIAELVTPTTCLANRGLVKLAMRRFHGAAEDLGGVLNATAKVPKHTRATTAVGAVDPGGRGVATTAAATGVGATTLAEGALDCLDSELGRALAEGRLQNRASREASGNRLRKLLRSARLLAGEVASIRIGLGNLAATTGENRRAGNKYFPTPAAAAADGSPITDRSVQPRHLERQNATVDPFLAAEKGGGGRALRQFLHAIHACPTASAAWLNASEVLETAVEQGGEATRKFPSSFRSVGGENAGGNPDSLPHRATTTTMGEAAAAVTPSLALVDSVLAMAPSHHAALRCRASVLARLGRTSDALGAADRALSAAERTVRAAEGKLKNPGPGSSSGYASASASTSMFLPSAASAGGENHSGRRQQSDTPTSAEVDLGASAKPRAGKRRESATVGGDGDDGGARGGCGVQPWPFTPKPIGFMRSSKVKSVVGGLLLTGGGKGGALDVAKSLVLRGCLRQKMGRRQQAEDDYRQALRICHNRLHEIEDRLDNHRTEVNTNSNNDQTVIAGGDEHSASVQRRGRALGEIDGGRASGQTNVGEKKRAALEGEKMGGIPDETNSFINDGATKPAYNKHPPAFRGLSESCKGAVGIGDSSDHQDGRCEILKLESLIHHNLATVHLATVLGTDGRASFQKAAIAREASEFVACQERANCTLRQTPTATRVQNKHESWWHATVLAVAHMVSTTGPGAVPCRGATTLNSNNPGRSARLQLGSAEIAAKNSNGYDDDDPQELLSTFSLAGGALSRALVAIRVNLAAAEKIGALSLVSSESSSRREGLSSAIETMSSAIDTMNARPELYIERAGLLAMMDGGGGGKWGGKMMGCESGKDYGQAAASDFATALWFSHSHD